MNILDKIVIDKRIEVDRRKQVRQVAELEKAPGFKATVPSFYDAIKKRGPSVIAEFKRKSPSKGIINPKAKPGNVIRAYEMAGVDAGSVLTDKYFKGRNEDLSEAFQQCNIPLLRKDFIIDEYQVVEARSCGASAILLIASILTRKQVENFSELATSLGMDVLFEIHEKEEMDKSSENIRIIGVNNRDLRTFKVDLNSSLEIIGHLPETCLKVSESGISQPGVVMELFSEGFDGFLMGETFMGSADPGLSAKIFMNKLKQQTTSYYEN